MKNILRKYLTITKRASGDIVVEDNDILKSSISEGRLGDHLYNVYGISKIMFAEPGYMQFKFVFDCETNEFKLVRYPKGTKSVTLTKDPKFEKIYKILMEKATGSNGWLFKNMLVKFDVDKREELDKQSDVPSIEVKTVIPKEELGSSLIFGDSQIEGNIGKELEARFGGHREGIPGSNAEKWISEVTSGSLSGYMAEKPANIFILLGGNGAGGIKNLLNEIHNISPNSNINFISLPSPAYPTGKETKYKSVFGRGKEEFNYKDLYEKRSSNFESSKEQVESSVPGTKGKAKFIDIFSIRWECESECDGIHVTPKAAKEIVSTINIQNNAMV